MNERSDVPATRLPFKERLDARAIARLGEAVGQAWPAFDVAAFARDATHGLAALELTPRVAHVGEALRRHLPAAFPEVAAILSGVAERWRSDPTAERDGFTAWPLFHVVPAAGLDHFALGMETLRRLTPLFSAEMAIRPFIDRDPAAAFALLHDWARDPDEHVRRLVSEGTRPRLPWATRVAALSADPEPGLGLLDALVDDPSPYVRRSVANHLNDVAHDRPARAVDQAARWLSRPTPERLWIVRHALRTRIKAGDPAALALLGHDTDVSVVAGPLALAPAEVPFSGRVAFEAALTNTGAAASWIVDFAVHFAGARGPRRKVFKGARWRMAAGETRTAAFGFDFRPITTRRYWPGDHGVELLVNGRAIACGAFVLLPP